MYNSICLQYCITLCMYVCCVCIYSNIGIQSMNLIYIYNYTEYIIVIKMIIFLLELAFLNKSFNYFELFNPCNIIHTIHMT